VIDMAKPPEVRAVSDAGDRLSWREQRLGNTPVAFLTQINILPRYSS